MRSQFGNFEEAQERVRHWVKYYNHKRPHQGIGGLFPADRYFEIQGERRGSETAWILERQAGFLLLNPGRDHHD